MAIRVNILINMYVSLNISILELFRKSHSKNIFVYCMYGHVYIDTNDYVTTTFSKKKMLQKWLYFFDTTKYLQVQQKIHAHFSSIHRLENTLGHPETFILKI